MINAIRRKRGELNLNVEQLSKETGVSRWTLDDLLKDKRSKVQNRTMHRLNDWLYKQV
ncbi:helix-turn-helix domain-containing protein [Secundilactobacillus yichangensis]|uniref:helix-turn-helix domain-containing protein n=1 Tax=Secundilactobacillus yichangensis TaxID=2799580 RepID=UPI001F2E0B40|nr:helix-turn-helix transcriptional regulator [Secundilactobacillus yichangensis]